MSLNSCGIIYFACLSGRNFLLNSGQFSAKQHIQSAVFWVPCLTVIPPWLPFRNFRHRSEIHDWLTWELSLGVHKIFPVCWNLLNAPPPKKNKQTKKHTHKKKKTPQPDKGHWKLAFLVLLACAWFQSNNYSTSSECWAFSCYWQHTQRHMCIHTHIKCTHTHTQCVHTYTCLHSHTHTHVYTHTHWKYLLNKISSWFIWW